MVGELLQVHRALNWLWDSVTYWPEFCQFPVFYSTLASSARTLRVQGLHPGPPCSIWARSQQPSWWLLLRRRRLPQKTAANTLTILVHADQLWRQRFPYSWTSSLEQSADDFRLRVLRTDFRQPDLPCSHFRHSL